MCFLIMWKSVDKRPVSGCGAIVVQSLLTDKTVPLIADHEEPSVVHCICGFIPGKPGKQETVL